MIRFCDWRGQQGELRVDDSATLTLETFRKQLASALSAPIGALRAGFPPAPLASDDALRAALAANERLIVERGVETSEDASTDIDIDNNSTVSDAQTESAAASREAADVNRCGAVRRHCVPADNRCLFSSIAFLLFEGSGNS